MRILMTLFLSLLPLAALAETTRPVSGSLMIRERIALPPEAEIVLQLVDTSGAVLLSRSAPTGGAQSPFPFSLDAPQSGSLTFRAAIRVDDAFAWLSAPKTVAPGPEAVDLGTLIMRRHKPMGFSSKLSCGELRAELGFIGALARLRIGGRYWDLEAEETASGSKFVSATDPDTWIWTRGDVATLRLDGAEFPECRQMLPEDRYVLRGPAGSWRLVFENGQMRYSDESGETEISAQVPAPQTQDGSRRYAAPDAGMTVTLSMEICRDGRTGIPYPDRAVVEIDGQRLQGCAGDPRDLLSAHTWRVARIAGDAVIDGAEVTLQFNAADRLAGRGGCNRFTAGYELTETGLSVSPSATTLMACEETLMQQERRFLDSLAQVTRFQITPEGDLQLMSDDAPVLRAHPSL